MQMAQIELVILAVADRGVEAAEVPDQRGTEQRRRGRDARMQPHGIVEPARARALLRRHRPSGGIDALQAPEGEGGLRVPAQGREADRHAIGAQHVVAIEEDHEIPARPGQSGIARRRDPAVRLGDAKRVRMAADHRETVVGGAVIDDDHLHIGMGLSEPALDRAADEIRAVVAGDDNGHPRCPRRELSYMTTTRDTRPADRDDLPRTVPTYRETGASGGADRAGD